MWTGESRLWSTSHRVNKFLPSSHKQHLFGKCGLHYLYHSKQVHCIVPHCFFPLLPNLHIKLPASVDGEILVYRRGSIAVQHLKAGHSGVDLALHTEASHAFEGTWCLSWWHHPFVGFSPLRIFSAFCTPSLAYGSKFDLPLSFGHAHSSGENSLNRTCPDVPPCLALSGTGLLIFSLYWVPPISRSEWIRLHRVLYCDPLQYAHDSTQSKFLRNAAGPNDSMRWWLCKSTNCAFWIKRGKATVGSVGFGTVKEIHGKETCNNETSKNIRGTLTSKFD